MNKVYLCGGCFILFGIGIFGVTLSLTFISTSNFNKTECFVLEKFIIDHRGNWKILDLHNNNRTSIIDCNLFIDSCLQKYTTTHNINYSYDCSYNNKEEYSWVESIKVYYLFLIPASLVCIILSFMGIVLIKEEKQILEKEKNYQHLVNF